MIKLYSYWRSSAAYRVRIALNLKVLDYQAVPVHLLKDGGEQHAEAYKTLNPQELVPLLEEDGFLLPQSLAIFQYLEDRYPEPRLTPADPWQRARMWAFCQAIACDIHPLNNLRVLQYLQREFGVADADKDAWYRHWIAQGFAALETMLAGQPETPYAFGTAPTFADCCLVPQWYNAERFKCDTAAYPRLAAVVARCREHPAFAQAHPDRQVDARA